MFFIDAVFCFVFYKKQDSKKAFTSLPENSLDYAHAGHGRTNFHLRLIKRFVGKFKQRTNVPYPYHYKKGVL